TALYGVLEMLAEVKTHISDPSGSETWDMKKLMFRQFERRPLSHYKVSRIRESIVLLLDSSGSMEWWEEAVRAFADAALARGDVELYIAPNGHIEERVGPRGAEPVDHEEVMATLRGRRIIYVGDYDGANTIIELSWANDVVWVCPESRYRRFRAHDWVNYDEIAYRGAFIRAYTIEEAISALRRVVVDPHAWVDPHMAERFNDDWGVEEP
ncbi:MAG: hypothetical protein ACP5ME_15415, partial [Anaerolineae bacterium]